MCAGGGGGGEEKTAKIDREEVLQRYKPCTVNSQNP